MKAGIAYEELGKYKEALEVYKTFKPTLAKVEKAEILRSILRVEFLLKKKTNLKHI